MRGYVKRWNSERGYGFVVGQDAQDYFVHYSEIEGNGRKDLTPNDVVEFDADSNAKGPKAVKVKVILE